jgi:hypothetical protein
LARCCGTLLLIRSIKAPNNTPINLGSFHLNCNKPQSRLARFCVARAMAAAPSCVMMPMPSPSPFLVPRFSRCAHALMRLAQACGKAFAMMPPPPPTQQG